MANNVTGFPAQCGVDILYDLSEQTAQQQYQKLKDALGGKAMIIFSDTEGREHIWAEAKKIATRTKAMVNPNSDNTIRVYMFRPDDLKDFEKLLKKMK